MHAFTVGAAVISLMRWLSELRERLPKDSPAMLRQQVSHVTRKTQGGTNEQIHAVIHVKKTLDRHQAGKEAKEEKEGKQEQRKENKKEHKKDRSKEKGHTR